MQANRQVSFVDLCGETDKSLTSVHLATFHEFVESDFDLYGTFDDDAYFGNPQGALWAIRSYALWHLIYYGDRELGAIGPMSRARLNRIYDGIAGSYGNLHGPPWMFYGCQFYTREFFKRVDWKGLLSGLKYWSDFALLMEAHRQGLAIIEVDLPEYVHQGAKGRVAKADAWPAQEAIDQVQKENIFLHEWFKDTSYIFDIDRMHERLIETRLRPRLTDPNAKHRG
jgi:hypothetical protein